MWSDTRPTHAVADRFPSAHVLGLDLTPIQPLWVPPNVEFLVDDCYQDWLSHETADLVHFRFMAIVLRDIPCVVEHAYKYVHSPVPGPVYSPYCFAHLTKPPIPLPLGA